MLSGSLTPVVDAALSNPLAVPPGVGSWLRTWERRLHLALKEVDGALAPHRAVPAWDDAVSELRGIDPDAPDGVFRLLLHRPLWQLDEGSAARETFDRYAETALERVSAARALVREIEPLLSEREYLLDEYGARFPNRLAEELARVRACEVDIGRLRRASDAIRMRTRLVRARRALEQLADVLEEGEPDVTDGQVVADETETLWELRAALAIARRERRQLVLHPVALREHRAHLLAQLRGLSLSAPASARGPHAEGRRAGHTAVVLERLINAIESAGANVLHGSDAPLWTGTLSAALAAHHPGLDRFAWLPALLSSDASATLDAVSPAADADLLHAIPLGDGLVYLSPLGESAVRVYTRTVRLGEAVECQVAPDMVARHVAPLVDADVGSLFDGLDTRRSRWYQTAVRARAMVVGRHANGWFARLERKGVLSVTEQPPWHTEGPGSAFRVLRAADRIPDRIPDAPRARASRSSGSHAQKARPPADEAKPQSSSTSVEALETVVPTRDAPLSTFLGFTLREVRTGLLGDERGWIRGVTSRWAGAAEAVRTESELFAKLHGRSADTAAGGNDLALRPVTWVRVADERYPCPLYRTPIATLDTPARLRSWLVERDEQLLVVLAGVARIVAAAHACDFAIGVCHSEAFAYGVTWAPDPLTPMPTPVLVHAPCATRLGEPFAPPGAASLSPTHYTMLRTPLLVPQVAGAQIATAERDMQGFGAFVLDLLLERPIFERGALDWYDAPGVVRARASQCSAHPTVAKHLGDLIQDPLGWRRIGDMLMRLAAGRVRKVADLL